MCESESTHPDSWVPSLTIKPFHWKNELFVPLCHVHWRRLSKIVGTNPLAFQRRLNKNSNESAEIKRREITEVIKELLAKLKSLKWNETEIKSYLYVCVIKFLETCWLKLLAV